MRSTVKKGVGVGLLLFSCCAASLLTQPAKADDVYTFVIKKQEEKAKYRWSLADWFATRDQMRLQDLWLAAHSSPFEYFIGGNYQFNQDTSNAYFSGYELNVGAFSSLVGLEGHVEKVQNNARVYGIFDFRFVGRHDQGTNLTAQVGVLNTVTLVDSYRSVFAGMSLTFYIARFFGFQGNYRYFFSSTPTLAGISYSGTRLSGGGFIDFRFVRLYADYFSDNGSGPSYSGLIGGTKIYF